MRRALTPIAVVVTAVVVAGSSSGGAARASLQLLQGKPLVVRGAGFRAAEKVRVTVYAKVGRVKRATAASDGTFRSTFRDVALSRCERVRVVAVGNRGSRAELKRPQLPGCLPV